MARTEWRGSEPAQEAQSSGDPGVIAGYSASTWGKTCRVRSSSLLPHTAPNVNGRRRRGACRIATRRCRGADGLESELCAGLKSGDLGIEPGALTRAQLDFHRLLQLARRQNRKKTPERGAAVGVLLGPDRAAVRGDNRPDNRQPEAEALLPERHERLEHALELTLRNTRTAIRQGQVHDAIGLVRGERQLALALRATVVNETSPVSRFLRISTQIECFNKGLRAVRMRRRV